MSDALKANVERSFAIGNSLKDIHEFVVRRSIWYSIPYTFGPTEFLDQLILTGTDKRVCAAAVQDVSLEMFTSGQEPWPCELILATTITKGHDIKNAKDFEAMMMEEMQSRQDLWIALVGKWR